MILYTHEARSSWKQVAETLQKDVAKIPGDVLPFGDVQELGKCLAFLVEYIEAEETEQNLAYYKGEIDRVFRVLGADKGFDQNATDICAWFHDGLINESEHHELRKYNRTVYHELPLDA